MELEPANDIRCKCTLKLDGFEGRCQLPTNHSRSEMLNNIYHYAVLIIGDEPHLIRWVQEFSYTDVKIKHLNKFAD